MCGITGFWGKKKFHPSLAERMARHLATRGPDDAGVWFDDKAGVAFAHRRLSILDLSTAGHQPMQSPCGRYMIVYNGEIYNHQDLRVELETEGGAFNWRSYADTETLLAALRHWGIQGALERINGMFAFALWDCSEGVLYLARDRMGEKPLYYGRSGDMFLFASELKAMTVHPSWKGEVERDALALYMRHGYIPAPWSIYKGILKLPPAHFVVITADGCGMGDPVCYWDLGQVAKNGCEQDANVGAETLVDELDALLRDSVSRRMMADVPLGTFLSGGYDSSLVTALMQVQSECSVKSFFIGFHEDGYDEAKHAKAVANHLGTDHTELYVTPEEAMAVIPKLASIYDEPFSDSSQIPTYLVSRLARQHVTVSLSGDGGDELFYGYRRYSDAERIWTRLRSLPYPIRCLTKQIANHALGKVFEVAMNMLPRGLRIKHLADRLPKFSELLESSSDTAFYREMVSLFKAPGTLVLGATEPSTLLNRSDLLPALPGLSEKMMYLDQMTYLPNDILTKVDRASMAVSLEARVPFLDHRVVEFAWRVPTAFKYCNGQGKWLLRQVLYRYVPQELMDRPKQGFGVPIEHWLRGPLHDWAENLLNENRLREDAFFDPAPIRKMWEEHATGKRRWHYYLWNVLMFQEWLQTQKG